MIGRRGAAFLLLVVLVTMVVLAAVRTMVVAETSSRRHDLLGRRNQTLAAAIDAAMPIVDNSFQTCRLPIDEAANEFIQVTLDQNQSIVTATWYQGDKVVDEMTRQIHLEEDGADQ
ncbi:hypothetical protein Q31b_00420 [Novipirellula aureliae]|uniref:Uncharacterized protein n=2 Tax=Novipirellula aureliae TaxID=2527966 RepID=A0A5C6E7E5_9BACT|nr:hypothetical protein Q31b_00420 [Novipirellula aureliae]